ncbi:hypothetical protein M9H77_16176 [Catharanthus roseus]|uniref:Uncharacterized protein n=1 Tax=Catharanthus roseus TaxID=4058 RepID=A0ACC0B195_CATRO|nr:hypothetical protein M9H77_16176 [Catharanthus roseus]
MIEKVLRLSTERGYTVFHRNREDNNVLSDIVVTYPTSIAIIRTWPYALIMDTAYKTKKYNMLLLECVEMTPTGKNFTVATTFMSNEQATIMDELKKTRQKVEEPGKHDRDMKSEMRDLTSLLHEISTSPISNVREVSRCQPPQKTTVTKGRRKTNSTKKDKSYWEYVSIAHRKIGKSSGLGSRSGSGSGSGSNPSPRGRGRPPRSGRVGAEDVAVNVVGDGNCGFRVISNFLFGDENHWVEIRRRMSYDLWHRMNVYEQLFGSVECVTELIMKTNWEEGLAPPEY